MLDESISPSDTSPQISLPPPTQPDHFYSPDGNLDVSSLVVNGNLLSPDDDPLATRGIPVFKPTMEEFADFESYMNRIEGWGMRSGIVKIIPPKEWTDALPSVKGQLSNVRIKSPIEQHMLGRAGIFRQQNIERRKMVSVREWSELCAREDFRAPAVFEVGLKAPEGVSSVKRSRRRGRSTPMVDNAPNKNNVLKEEITEVDIGSIPSSSRSGCIDENNEPHTLEDNSDVHTRKGYSKLERKVKAERNAELDTAFYENFDPKTSWLPAGTAATDYTPEFCSTLERRYWRNCGLGRPAWYGADTAGSLFTDQTTSWNVGCLSSALSRLLPKSSAGLPGVNTPYLYFGMWRATFAWHVEDMDLFSINYIHFGAPKFWYAVPQGRASQLENTLKSYFPLDSDKCKQFLRHKSYFASPTLLAKGSCKPNTLVQHAGEFVITYPRGYHAGFNLGLNCAESVNFALNSWLDIGRKAQACGCVGDSVRIDVDALMRARDEETKSSLKARHTEAPDSHRSSGEVGLKHNPRKRKKDDSVSLSSKKTKTTIDTSWADDKSLLAGPSTLPTPISPIKRIKLKIPAAKDRQFFPCCLCVSQNSIGLLPVSGIPTKRSGCQNVMSVDLHGVELWRAHEKCALVVPETWVDEVVNEAGQSEKMIFGVDTIVKDRWNLKCSACQKPRSRVHGAPIQCTKGKCPKAFHVSCASEGDPDTGLVFKELRQVERQVICIDSTIPTAESSDTQTQNQESIASTSAWTLDEPTSTSKTITKIEYEMLCSQHNPATAALKKANKLNRVRETLLALPEMSRVKVRVSTGVFEVSLLSVDEEGGTIDVLWNDGIKRTFKWSSLIWVETQGEPIRRKPSVTAPQELQQQDARDKKMQLEVDTPNAVKVSQQHVTSTGSSYFSAFPTSLAGGSGKFSYENSAYDLDATNLCLGSTPASSFNVIPGFNPTSLTMAPQLRASTSTSSQHVPYNHYNFSQSYASWKKDNTPILAPNQHMLQFSYEFQQALASSVALLPPRSGSVSLVPETAPKVSIALNSQITSNNSSTEESGASSSNATSVQNAPGLSDVIQELETLSNMEAMRMQEALDAKPALKEALKQVLDHLARQQPQ